MLVAHLRRLLLIALVAGPLVPAPRTPAALPPASLRYQAPVPGALYVQAPTTLALRLDDALDAHSLTASLFTVSGSASGDHTGTTHVALDGRTALFDPKINFTPGETVSVTIAAGLTTQAGAVWPGAAYTFTVSTVGSALSAAAVTASLAAEAAEDPGGAGGRAVQATTGLTRTVDPRHYVTLPAALPVYTVTGTLSGTVSDTYALGLIPWIGYDAEVVPSHLLLVDGRGEPVYYQTQSQGGWAAIDLKRQPGNRLSYWAQHGSRFHLLDNTYTEVDTIGAGNGYLADLHELQMLPNGEALLMIYDYQPVDMSQVISDGLNPSLVAGVVIQAIDAADDVVFEWRTWDHFPITETSVPLIANYIDYVHSNALELDGDGNLLLSSRHLDEITKIDRDTGAIIWRWGGLHNEFTFIDDPEGRFYHQHDVRRLPNGNVSLFDNHNETAVVNSRAVIYALDEISKTATLVWAYHHAPEVMSFAMGSHSQTPDGRTLIGWGSAPEVALTELDPDGSTRLELTVDPVYRSYRGARFPWVAAPPWPPLLVLTNTAPVSPSLTAGPALYFSWNGATEVGSYAIYAGFSPATPTLVRVVPRTGFEDHVLLADLVNAPANTCAYRVQALDRAAQPLAFTNLVYVSQPCPVGLAFLPAVLQPPSAAALFWPPRLGH